MLALEKPFFEQGARSEAQRTGADQNCYQVSNLTLETKIAPMREWLVTYNARVRVSAEVLFILYIPPQPSKAAAERLVKRLRGFSEFSQAEVIKRGIWQNGVSVGRFSKHQLDPLVALLLESGYAPALKPVYNARQQPVMRVLGPDMPIEAASFEKAFPGHRLIPFPNCNLF